MNRAGMIVVMLFGVLSLSMITFGPLATIQPGQEPQGAWTPRTGILVYDDESANVGTPVGWAWTPNGITWNVCNADNTGNCNGVAKIDTTRILDFDAKGGSFLRHHSVAAEGGGDRVVYVTLADIDKNPNAAERVVGLVSIDGGKTFKTAFPLNDPASNHFTCSDDQQDMPHASFDYTTVPPTLRVVWRNSGSIRIFGQPIPVNACVRRFFLDPSNALVPLDDDATPLLGMDREKQNRQAGGVKIQAGNGAITVVYQNTDELLNCPNKQTISVGWSAITSFDNGLTWNDPTPIFHTKSFRSCVLDVAGKPVVQNTIRAFDFVRTPTGLYYVALNDSVDTIRLFMSPAAGTIGQDARLPPWFQWCAPTGLPPPTPFSPASNWKIVDPKDPCSVFNTFITGEAGMAAFPTLASDGDNRVSVVDYEGDFANPGQLKPVYRGNVAPQQPTFPNGPDFQLSRLNLPFGPPADLKLPNQTVSQPLGSYMGLSTRVAPGGTLDEPGCGGNGLLVPPAVYDFFPAWAQQSQNAAFVASRQVVLTP